MLDDFYDCKPSLQMGLLVQIYTHRTQTLHERSCAAVDPVLHLKLIRKQAKHSALPGGDQGQQHNPCMGPGPGTPITDGTRDRTSLSRPERLN